MEYAKPVPTLNALIKLALFVPQQAPQIPVTLIKCVDLVLISSAMIATTFARKRPQTKQAILMAGVDCASLTQNVLKILRLSAKQKVLPTLQPAITAETVKQTSAEMIDSSALREVLTKLQAATEFADPVMQLNVPTQIIFV